MTIIYCQEWQGHKYFIIPCLWWSLVLLFCFIVIWRESEFRFFKKIEFQQFESFDISRLLLWIEFDLQDNNNNFNDLTHPLFFSFSYWSFLIMIKKRIAITTPIWMQNLLILIHLTNRKQLSMNEWFSFIFRIMCPPNCYERNLKSFSYRNGAKRWTTEILNTSILLKYTLKI